MLKVNDAVLVLNANYEPINIAPLRRAFNLVLKGIAHVEEHNGIVEAGKATYKIPSVIRLMSYRRIPHFKISPSRRNILQRDDFTCQYCVKRFVAQELTLDHIMPRSRGGRSTWDNLVAACYKCNHRKNDQTPEEAGMKLHRKPVPLSIHTNRHVLRSAGKKFEAWQKYLFY
jgi:5-methylcytosine-specific restriction endonuclease McrA